MIKKFKLCSFYFLFFFLLDYSFIKYNNTLNELNMNVFQNTITYSFFTFLTFRIRLHLKLFFKKIGYVNSFCRYCGCDVRDFHIEDKKWIEIFGKEGGVLCYNCLCDKTGKRYELKEL